jgi:hypothetical protein
MNVLAEIKKLEELVQNLIAGATGANYFDTFSNVYTSNILARFSDDFAALSDAQITRIVTASIEEAVPFLKSETRKDIAERLTKSLQATTEFYAARGLSVPDLKQLLTNAPLASQVYDLLTSAIDEMSDKLRDVTIELAKEAALNNKGRRWLEDEIMIQTNAKLFSARVNAKLVTSALNQITRNDFANLAGVQHFLYYGLASNNTRPFCNYHLNKVYTREQIEQMNNGQLDPVLIFKGGYNCKHTWLPVDVGWDPSLNRAFDANRAPQMEPLAEGSNNQITIFP